MFQQAARWYGYGVYGLLAIAIVPFFFLSLAVGWAGMFIILFVLWIPALIATPFLLWRKDGRKTLDDLFHLEFLNEEGPFCEMYWRYYTPWIMVVTRARDGERIGIDAGVWVWEDKKTGLFTTENSMRNAFSLTPEQMRYLISDWEDNYRDKRNPHARS